MAGGTFTRDRAPGDAQRQGQFPRGGLPHGIQPAAVCLGAEPGLDQRRVRVGVFAARLHQRFVLGLQLGVQTADFLVQEFPVLLPLGFFLAQFAQFRLGVVQVVLALGELLVRVAEFLVGLVPPRPLAAKVGDFRDQRRHPLVTVRARRPDFRGQRLRVRPGRRQLLGE